MQQNVKTNDFMKNSKNKHNVWNGKTKHGFWLYKHDWDLKGDKNGVKDIYDIYILRFLWERCNFLYNKNVHRLFFQKDVKFQWTTMLQSMINGLDHK